MMTPITLHAPPLADCAFNREALNHTYPTHRQRAQASQDVDIRNSLPFDSLEHNRPRATLQDRPVNRRKAPARGLRLKA
jgi:hypothetical protein